MNRVDDFFEKAISSLKEKLRAGWPKKAPEPEFDAGAAQSRVDRGQRTREFLGSNFWTLDMEPLLKSESERSRMRPWRPGDPIKDDAVWAEYLYGSGKAAAMAVILEILGSWVEEGERAVEQLKAEAERQKRVSDARRSPLGRRG